MHTSIYVFVYGTLRRGEINDLARAAERAGLPAPRNAGPGRVPGRLVDFGDWPGLLPPAAGADARPILGELYQVTPELLALMDQIEEYTPHAPCCFVRADTLAHTASGAIACQYYPIDPAFRGQAPDIDEDDWVAYRLSRDAARPAGTRAAKGR
ncbi:AIG2-like family [Bordetella ansorpii]|uniref:AIG2-like family n=1 Tax=Bordetella ansorpii TaxID=288768 RepID=A0A157SPC2_9BORD|nr:gamma-glutamylcyclotransferase family protein [Bordetella ansorpii]SAI72262.1 AIG2-like family [Bordetella ansorpii]